MSEMTREQRDMAVAVAKDAILQLSLPVGAPTMQEMVYLEIDAPRGFKFPEGDEDLRGHVGSLQPYCRVCQIGVMFLSMVRLYNNAPASLIDRPEYCGTASVDPLVMRAILEPVFGRGNVQLMEHAFEGFSKDYGDFENTYLDPTERALAILENVVANDGEFLPQGPDEEVAL